MDNQTVAGEPVDVLVRAFRCLKFRKTRDGMVRISVTLDRELGLPFQRALMRVERDLLTHDIDHAGEAGVGRTSTQRAADAVVALALRIAEAQAGA